jgi:hypothetical protein
MRMFLCSLLLVGCFNAKHASVSLRNNPDGADCFARCSAGDDAARMACVAACPSARVDGGTCSAEPGTACAQTRKLSGWKTAGCVVLGLAAVLAVSP